MAPLERIERRRRHPPRLRRLRAAATPRALVEVIAEDAVWRVPGTAPVVARVPRPRRDLRASSARPAGSPTAPTGASSAGRSPTATHAVAVYRARGTRLGRELDIDQVLLITLARRALAGDRRRPDRSAGVRGVLGLSGAGQGQPERSCAAASKSAPSGRAGPRGRRGRRGGRRRGRRSSSPRRAAARARRRAPRCARSRARRARAASGAGGRSRLRPLRLRLADFGFGGGGSARRRGGAGTRPSRPRRRRGAPSSIASTRPETASSSARSWVTSSTVPGNASSAASSASRLSRSRWFVGSSSTRKFAPLATTSASASRRRSPPDSAVTGFSCASQPEKRKRPSSFCASGRRSPVAADRRVEHRAALVELDLVLREVRRLDAVAELHPARRRARGGRGSSRAASSCPTPFGPISATCSPRSSANDASVQQLLVAGAQVEPLRLDDDPPGPRRLAGTRSRASAAAPGRPRRGSP